MVAEFRARLDRGAIIGPGTGALVLNLCRRFAHHSV